MMRSTLCARISVCVPSRFQATGAMTNTVELANAKYGGDPSYRAYVEATPLIIPPLSWVVHVLAGGRAE